ncbi:enoyl-CoA hydratase/isomerase family protein [Lysinimonas soli]|uniref:Enoyl-CoA hydratase/isomerase family protein n=1 Tax=Lysinimonas soli TaxID=1074233 RepID=A0ABW0NSJ3_9MICO
MTEPLVITAIDTGVASLTLNRPALGNAMSIEMLETLLQGLRDAEADPDCRVAVLHATGRVFCGGGDLHDLARAGEDEELRQRMVTVLQDGMYAFAASPLVVICAVNGAAAGAGLGLVLNTDLVLASSRATFLGAYGAIGLSPDAGVSYLLPPAIGSKRAAAMLLAGRPVTAQEALDWGLVAELVEPDEVDSRADEWARRLADGPSHVLAATKRLLGAERLAGYRAHLDAEAADITGFAAHPDTRARIAALLEKSRR